MTNSDYKFRMEVPNAMISDAIKKKEGYMYYMAKKLESEKAKIVDESKEQHVSLVKSRKGKEFMCYGDQVLNAPNKLKKDDVLRKTRSLTIAEEIVVVADTYAEWGQKLKDTDSDATLYSSSSDKTKKSANETGDADESEMDLSNDNPNRDNDVARPCLNTYVLEVMKNNQINPFTHLSTSTDDLPEMDLKLNLLNRIHSNKLNETHTTHQQLYDTLYESITHNQQELDAQDAESSFHKRSHDNQDPPNNREGENKKKGYREDEYIRTRQNPKWYTKSGSVGATKRKTAWFDLLLKSDIDQNENHSLRPSTVVIAKKLKAIIQKDELTIADLEGARLERLKQKY
nr:hypothetical protein [Tanacetum cinerariifolium]